MRNLLCHLLIVWLALMSGGAAAHGIKDFAHEAQHQQTHVQHACQDQAVNTETATTADTSHADTCNQSHCGHGHTTGMLKQQGTCIKTDASAQAPTSHLRWASKHIINTIERPKWVFATHAVVNL